MKLKLSFSRGFSLIEVLIAAVIFAATVLAVFSGVALMRKPVQDSDRRLDAAIYGKQILEALRSKIDVDTWSYSGPNALFNGLDTGLYTSVTPTMASDLGVTLPTGMAVGYKVFTYPANDGYRKVELNVYY